MREILFRGRRIDNGEWVNGYLVKKTDTLLGIPYCFIVRQDVGFNGMLEPNASWYHVDPATVGQYTGLKDRNGVRIFEGDVIKMSDGKIGAVVFDDVCAGYGLKGIGDGCCLCVSTESERLVIGNIHDDPALLEV